MLATQTNRALARRMLEGTPVGEPADRGGRRHRPSVFGRNVKHYRELRGMSQRELVEKSGVTSVPRLENGQNQGCSRRHQEALARVLRVTVDALHKGNGNTHPVLAEFLERGFGRGATDEEKAFLREIPTYGYRPTEEMYTLYLMGFRAKGAPED